MAGRGRQCIVACGSGHWRWQWDWQDNPGTQPASYPSVIVGHSPWNPAVRGDAQHPRPLAEVGHLRGHHEFQIRASGRWNVAYNLWLIDGNIASPASIRVEIMVWIRSYGSVQAHGRGIEQTERFALYSGRRASGEAAWNCFSFVMHSGQARTSVDLGELLQGLVKFHGVDPGLHLADVEFGTEIWDGIGTMELSTFNVTT